MGGHEYKLIMSFWSWLSEKPVGALKRLLEESKGAGPNWRDVKMSHSQCQCADSLAAKCCVEEHKRSVLLWCNCRCVQAKEKMMIALESDCISVLSGSPWWMETWVPAGAAALLQWNKPGCDFNNHIHNECCFYQAVCPAANATEWGRRAFLLLQSADDTELCKCL